jgi:hypothetical protein
MPEQVATQQKPEKPPRELCEFVNTDTGLRCQNAALWKCSASGIVDCIRVCSTHAKAFNFRAGCSVVKINHLL